MKAEIVIVVMSCYSLLLTRIFFCGLYPIIVFRVIYGCMFVFFPVVDLPSRRLLRRRLCLGRSTPSRFRSCVFATRLATILSPPAASPPPHSPATPPDTFILPAAAVWLAVSLTTGGRRDQETVPCFVNSIQIGLTHLKSPCNSLL